MVDKIRPSRTSESSRSARLSNSMRVLAKGVTKRDGGSSSVVANAVASLGFSIADIIDQIGNLGGGGASMPQVPVLTESDDPVLIQQQPPLRQALGKNNLPTFKGLTVTGASTLTGPVASGALTSTGAILAAGNGSDATKFLSGDGTYYVPQALGTVWTQVINELGTSLANWTQSSGSWSVASSAFHIDTGAATKRDLRWTAKIAQSALIFQADIKMESTGGFTGGSLVGLSFNTTGAPSLGCLISMRCIGNLNPASTGVIYNEQPAGVNGGPTALTNLFNLDQFYTLRIVAIGSVMDVYIDGIYKTTVMRVPWTSGTTFEHCFVTLLATNCRADFKNIKMYTLTLP